MIDAVIFSLSIGINKTVPEIHVVKGQTKVTQHFFFVGNEQSLGSNGPGLAFTKGMNLYVDKAVLAEQLV